MKVIPKEMHVPCWNYCTVMYTITFHVGTYGILNVIFQVQRVALFICASKINLYTLILQ